MPFNDRLLRACRTSPRRSPARLDDAPGRPLPSRVSRHSREARLPHDVQDTGARGRGLAATHTAGSAWTRSIVFSDILVPVEAMGVPVEFNPGARPREPVSARGRRRPLAHSGPRRGDADSSSRRSRGLSRELANDVPVIGFAGAPWTLASYAIEGGGSKTYATTKRMMYAEPALFHRLSEKLADTIADLPRRADRGRRRRRAALRFVGRSVSRVDDYVAFALPYTRRVVEQLRARPRAGRFTTSATASHLVEAAASAGADVLSVDWRTDIPEARRRSAAAVWRSREISIRACCSGRASVSSTKRGACSPRARGDVGLHCEPRSRYPSRDPRRERRSVHPNGPGRPQDGMTDSIDITIQGEHGARCRSTCSSATTCTGRATRAIRRRPNGTTTFGPDDLRRAFDDGEARAQPPVSLYFHIPFCESLCWFCGCNVIINREQGSRRHPYLDRLKTEIDRVARRVDAVARRSSSTGAAARRRTSRPSRWRDLYRLHGRARSRSTPDAEIGLEVDPRVTTHEHVATLAELGFNRVEHGRPGLRPEGPGGRQPQSRRSSRPRRLVEHCRAHGIHERQHRPDVRAAVPDASTSFLETVDASSRSRPTASRSSTTRTCRRFATRRMRSTDADARRASRSSRSSAPRASDSPTPATTSSASTTSRSPRTRWRARRRDRTLWRNFQGYTTKAGTRSLRHGRERDQLRRPARSPRTIATPTATTSGSTTASSRRCAACGSTRTTTCAPGSSSGCCATACSSRREIEAEFGIDFDSYFARRARGPCAVPRPTGWSAVSDDRIEVTPLGRLFIRNLAMPFDAYLRDGAGGETGLFEDALGGRARGRRSVRTDCRDDRCPPLQPGRTGTAGGRPAVSLQPVLGSRDHQPPRDPAKAARRVHRL